MKHFHLENPASHLSGGMQSKLSWLDPTTWVFSSSSSSSSSAPRQAAIFSSSPPTSPTSFVFRTRSYHSPKGSKSGKRNVGGHRRPSPRLPDADATQMQMKVKISSKKGRVKNLKAHHRRVVKSETPEEKDLRERVRKIDKLGQEMGIFEKTEKTSSSEEAKPVMASPSPRSPTSLGALAEKGPQALHQALAELMQKTARGDRHSWIRDVVGEKKGAADLSGPSAGSPSDNAVASETNAYVKNPATTSLTQTASSSAKSAKGPYHSAALNALTQRRSSLKADKITPTSDTADPGSTHSSSFSMAAGLKLGLNASKSAALRGGNKLPLGGRLAGQFAAKNGGKLANAMKLRAFDMAMCGDRKFGTLLGMHPCRDYEEKSCNLVGAVCSQVLKQSYAFPNAITFTKTVPGKVCNQGDATPEGLPMHATMPSSVGGNDSCHARMIDMPYKLRNSFADREKTATSLIKRNTVLALAMNKLYKTTIPVEVPLPFSVWGQAVHGKVGSWAFDSGGRHIYEHIYRIPQYHDGAPVDPILENVIPEPVRELMPEKTEGGRDDTYLCDSRRNPKHCALIGGNLFRCLHHFDEPACGSFCEDRGDRLVCDVRGWNTFHDMWAPVPVYPRDILGEMYRDEWRDFYSRPMTVKVEIPKNITENVSNFKVMPSYLVTDAKPQQSGMERIGVEMFGEATPPTFSK